jgi:DNA-binding CsgD family transcriptional regulator
MSQLIGIHRGVFPAEVSANRRIRPAVHGYLQYRPWVTALTLEARGETAEALSMLLDLSRRAENTLTVASLYYVYPDLARLAALTGDRAAAVEVAEAAERLISTQVTHGRLATALLCRGMAQRQPEQVAQAAEGFRVGGRPLSAGQAFEELAVLHAETGRLDEARAALGAALELFVGLDADWHAARAEARLRAHGLRRGRRGARKRPKTGWAALTVTENKVAELVAQGESNSDIAARLFLSRRTVQSHVASILAKVGLNSRVQLAVAYPGRT